MPIGLGASLGIGGGRSSTSSGAPGGEALTDNLAYPNGIFTKSNFTLSVQPVMHFDAYDMDGDNSGSANWSDGDNVTTGAGNIWVDRSQRDGTYDASQGTGANQPTYKVSGSDKYVDFDGNDVLALATSISKASGAAWTIANVAKTDSPSSSVFAWAPGATGSGSIQAGKWTNNTVYAAGTVGGSLGTSQDYTSLDMFLLEKNASNLANNFTSGNNSQGTYTTGSTFAFDSIGKSSASSYHNGEYREILLFASALSTDDKNVLRLFFANKYSSLPTLAAWT
jgi:hypothetical protein